MELTSDNPYWGVRNGLLHSYPSLDRDVVCDCAVVGGGITGALIAFYLIEAGVSVVLLDKRDVGTGSTSGSTGLLQYEVDVPLRQLRRQVGRAQADRSYELCHQAIDKLGALIGGLHIRCGFALRPSIQFARTKSELPGFRDELELRRALGIQVELWDQAEIRRHFPFQRPAALFSTHGAQTDPHALAHGLLQTGGRRGVKIFDRTKVLRFLPSKRSIQLATDKGFSVRAKRVVVATGYETKQYLGTAAGRLKSTFALVSEPLKKPVPWYRRSLIWETGSPYLYLRTLPDHRIIVGGEDESFINAKQRDALIPLKSRTLARKFQRLFPEHKLEVAYAWAGTFAETKDGLAYIGRHRNLPQAYFALGYGGNGITYSLIAAEIIRDDFLGRKNSDAAIFSFER